MRFDRRTAIYTGLAVLGETALALRDSASPGVSQGASLADGEEWLTDVSCVPPITPSNNADQPKQLSGVLVRHWLFNGPEGTSEAYKQRKDVDYSFDLQGRYSSIRYVVGVDRNVPGRRSTYRVEVDGKPVDAGLLWEDASPVVKTVDTKGAGSILFRLGPYIGFGNAIAISSEFEAGKQGGAAPVLLSPKAKEVISDTTVHFEWKPVPMASRYLIMIVQTKRIGKLRSPDARGWAVTVENATSHRWDITDIPSGNYSWSVLGFADDRVVGAYSVDRRFSIAR